MTGRILLDGANPQTQTVAAVKALLAWRGRASDPLPEFVELNSNGSRCVLVLSNKKDCYYVTTAADCSCPAHNWHPGQRCKHQRKFFAEQQTAKPAAIKQPNHGAWHGHNGPIIEDGERPAAMRAAKASSGDLLAEMHSARWDVEEDTVRPAKEPSSIPLVDTLPDPTTRDVAYWSIQEDKAMWPAEA